MSQRHELASSHTPDAVRQRLQAGPAYSYLRDFIYGAVDGTVTTFAVASGVAGAGLSHGVVIVLGMANLLGDGFSMAVGNYLSTRVDQEVRERARKREEYEIALFPAGEREEIRQIFAAKGFTGGDLERAVEIITSDVRRWVDTMMKDELGLSTAGPVPWLAATATFLAFVVVGFLPLFSFVAARIFPGAVQDPFPWSTGITLLAFFVVGALKARFVGQRWLWSGLQTVLVGGSAAGLAYLVGVFLHGVTAGG